MLYKLKVIILKRPFVQKIVGKIKILRNTRIQTDNVKLIKKYSAGNSFADIGCMWGVDGAYCFLAEETGATKVIAVDVYPESETFLKEKIKRNSKVKFVQGDINLPESAKRIGLCDVVFCSGVLYHSPDPFHLLLMLRSICKKNLILNTHSIPEMPGIRNTAVFYPFLNEQQRKVWNFGIGQQRSITGEYEPQSGYGNWFWGLSPSCIESMLKCAGFKVKKHYIFPFSCLFVCQPDKIQFAGVSGEWTTPQDKDFLKLKKITIDRNQDVKGQIFSSKK